MTRQFRVCSDILIKDETLSVLKDGAGIHVKGYLIVEINNTIT
jgi:hypothetical protein